MIHRPRFKDHLRAEVVLPDRVILLSESSPIEIDGRIYALLAQLIDGRRTVQEIVNQVDKEAGILDVVYGISWLEEQGHIAEATDHSWSTFSAFRDLLGVGPEDFEHRLESAKVRIISAGELSIDDFSAQLTSLNIQVSEEGDFWVVLTDDYLRDSLEDLSREAERLKRPWMLVKPVGVVLWIGPVFNPGQSPCFQCLKQRLEENRSRHYPHSEDWSAAFTPLCRLPTTWHAGLNMAATQVFSWVAGGGRTQLERRIVTWDAVSMETTSHALRQHPGCARCRKHAGRHADPKPLLLESRAKVFTWDGGHRAVSPERTLDNLSAHVSPITGIIPRLQFRGIDPNGLDQVFVTDWLSAKAGSGGKGRSALRNKCAGKGVTRVQAKVSALSEALERYSGIFQGHESRRRATYAELGPEAVHPNACMNFSEQQYARRLQWNSNHPPALHVPEPFDEQAEVEWTPIWSLSEQKFKYLPTAYCYFGYDAKPGRNFCGADSNGNAAGNTLEEAVIQGFMELVERDCASIWWYSQTRRPGVDLDSFNDPYFSELRKYHSSMERELWVLDITNDLGIPAFVAISRPRNGHSIQTLGFGAHFSAKLAALRALTELNQFLPGSLDNHKNSNDNKEGDSPDDAWMSPGEHLSPRKRENFHDNSSDDLLEDVTRCVQLAQKHGLETLVLDQTRPEVELNVVKVVVPGLRSWWARFGSGRLYDVPVLLGWRRQHQLESELNARHILL